MTRELPAHVAGLLPAKVHDIFMIEAVPKGFRVALFWRHKEVGEALVSTLAEARRLGATLIDQGYVGFNAEAI